MRPTSPRRPAGVFVPFCRFVIAASLGATLLAGAVSDSAATSLVGVQARGGPGNGAIARLASDDETVVSRSVGLMEGAGAAPGATALGDAPIVVSRVMSRVAGALA
jgi:hypothetical protein